MRNPGKRNEHLASLMLALASLTSLLVLAGYAANRLAPHNFQRGSAATASAAVLPPIPPPVCPGSIDAITTTPFASSAQVGLPCFPRGQTFTVASGKTTGVSCPGIPDCFVSVTVYDVCLQDDKTHDILLINSVTGHYKFTECGTGAFPPPDKKITFEGKGKIKREGNCSFGETITLSDPRVNATIKHRCATACLTSGNATVFATGRPGRGFRITDKSVCDNTCACDSTTTVSFTGTGQFITQCSNLSGIFQFTASAVFPPDYVRGSPTTRLVSGGGTAVLNQVDGTGPFEYSFPLTCGSMSGVTRVELLGCIKIGESNFKVVIEGTTNGGKGVMNTATCEPNHCGTAECP